MKVDTVATQQSVSLAYNNGDITSKEYQALNDIFNRISSVESAGGRRVCDFGELMTEIGKMEIPYFRLLNFFKNHFWKSLEEGIMVSASC
jgi:hypothetical protein